MSERKRRWLQLTAAFRDRRAPLGLRGRTAAWHHATCHTAPVAGSAPYTAPVTGLAE